MIGWLEGLLGRTPPRSLLDGQPMTQRAPEMRQASPYVREVPAYAPGVVNNPGGIMAELRDPTSTGSQLANALQGFVGSTDPFRAGRAIRAYHGSPHDFDRFRMDRIGTGEGAQAYGHGLYFAGNEGVARSYRDTLAPSRVSVDGVDLGALGQRLGSGTRGGVTSEQIQALGRAGKLTSAEQDALYFLDGAPDVATAIRNLREQAGMSWRGPDAQRIWRDRADTLEALAGRVSVTPNGRMYEVALHTSPERLLDWDAPLSQQPPGVRSALGTVGVQPRGAWEQADNNLFVRNGARGQEASIRAIDRYGDGNVQWLAQYDTLSGQGSQRFPTREAAQRWIDTEAPIEAGRGAEIYQEMRRGMPDAQITDRLRGAGIDGIRYLDAGSRAAGQGTHNYVMFDDNLIEIIRKYGLLPFMVGAPAVGGGLLSDAQAANSGP